MNVIIEAFMLTSNVLQYCVIVVSEMLMKSAHAMLLLYVSCLSSDLLHMLL